MKIFVIESPWSTNISDGTSVKPFIEGWSQLTGIGFSYRMYHGKDDLLYWLKKFMLHPTIKILYVAGHGKGGRISGLKKDVNMDTIANGTRIQGPHVATKKGILLGACDVGAKLDKFLISCGKRINWVAGYNKEVPWMEATFCDLLFIEYMISGRIKQKGEDSFIEKRGKYISTKPSSASLAAKWVKKDYALSERCGFKAVNR